MFAIGGSTSAPSTELDVVRSDYPLRTISKPKKIGWFTRWFMKKSEEVRNLKNEVVTEMNTKRAQPMNMTGSPIDLDNIGGMNFTITACDGGVLITTKYIEQQNFEVHTKRYIVPDGGNLGERIAEIFSFEALKR